MIVSSTKVFGTITITPPVESQGKRTVYVWVQLYNNFWQCGIFSIELCDVSAFTINYKNFWFLYFLFIFSIVFFLYFHIQISTHYIPVLGLVEGSMPSVCQVPSSHLYTHFKSRTLLVLFKAHKLDDIDIDMKLFCLSFPHVYKNNKTNKKKKYSNTDSVRETACETRL